MSEYGYFNAFGAYYSRWGIVFRILLFYGFICLETAILVYALVGYVTNWKYDTVVAVAPFG